MSEKFDLREQLLRMRKAGVPLLWIDTVDPAATENAIVEMAPNRCLIHWDVAEGFIGRSEAGQEGIMKIIKPNERFLYIKPIEALLAAREAPERSMLFFHHLQRFWDSPEIMQALKNLRDVFKADGNTLFVLGPPSKPIPNELIYDIKTIEEPYPGPDDLKRIVSESFEFAGLESPSDETMEKSVNALRGLPSYSAEQETSLALTNEDGFDIDELTERKRTIIDQQKGLSVYRGTERFEDIGGCQQIKKFLKLYFNGKDKPLAIVWIDELDKVFEVHDNDTSGITKDYLGILLQEMQDTQANGLLLLGPPGSGKSLTAKATGGEVEVPTIRLDAGGMKESLVGNSEANMRSAMRCIRSVSGGRTLYIATCNSKNYLPPELVARFTLGTFYHDLPGADEKTAIWKTYEKKYPEVNFYSELLPETDGWTGREIFTCCRLANTMDIPLHEAAKYIVPISISSREKVEALRKEANGRYLNAGEEGLYIYKQQRKGGRRTSTSM